jgi:zinc D-Ala-D-Ala dipeptidase
LNYVVETGVKNLYIIILSLFFVSCNEINQAHREVNTIDSSHLELIEKPEIDTVKTDLPIPRLYSELENKLIEMGLVDVQELDSSIVVDLRYASDNNFLGQNVYGDFNRCYLQPDVAEKLILAQLFLKTKFPQYSLIIFDAVRPRSIQQIMWDLLKMPVAEKTKYVSNPKNGSLHNYGAAVDLSIIDEKGEELDMGTPYDFFGELAYPRLEKQMLENGKLTQLQYDNRILLRESMQKAGFTHLTTEWWHFNSCSRTEAQQRYQIVE